MSTYPNYILPEIRLIWQSFTMIANIITLHKPRHHIRDAVECYENPCKKCFVYLEGKSLKSRGKIGKPAPLFMKGKKARTTLYAATRVGDGHRLCDDDDNNDNDNDNGISQRDKILSEAAVDAATIDVAADAAVDAAATNVVAEIQYTQSKDR